MKRPRAAISAAHRGLVALLLLPLRLYRALISPLLGPRCRYYPSCSAYAEEAVRTRGIVRGAALAAWRLARCNPFSDGGYDPVPSAEPRAKRGGGVPA